MPKILEAKYVAMAWTQEDKIVAKTDTWVSTIYNDSSKERLFIMVQANDNYLAKARMNILPKLFKMMGWKKMSPKRFKQLIGIFEELNSIEGFWKIRYLPFERKWALNGLDAVLAEIKARLKPENPAKKKEAV
jgi:hypothetical protein